MVRGLGADLGLEARAGVGFGLGFGLVGLGA